MDKMEETKKFEFSDLFVEMKNKKFENLTDREKELLEFVILFYFRFKHISEV